MAAPVEPYTPYRTVGTVMGGLAYLLLLAAIGGRLDLPPRTVENLGYAGTMMVLGQAAKAGVQRVAQARGPA